MKNLMLVVVGMAWFIWPGKSHALYLECDLPGYETEQHKPDVEWCIQQGCVENRAIKIPWGLCDEGDAWWTQELVDCYYDPGTGEVACFYAGSDIRCEEAGDGGTEDPWEDKWWWWCSKKINKVEEEAES